MSNFDTKSRSMIDVLLSGGVAVMRTDTLYGIVARANDQVAVERVYAIKGRTPSKPPIILIGSIDQLLDVYDDKTLGRVTEFWPGKNSLILPSSRSRRWLTRDSESLAYRLPDDKALQSLLMTTGPLIAPSANPEGMAPAMNIEEAKAYFGDSIDHYEDGGVVQDESPSHLYRLLDDGWERLR